MTELTKPFSAEEQAVSDALDAGDPHQLLAALVKHHPKMSRQKLCKMFVEIVRNDDKLKRAVIESTIDCHLKKLGR